MRFLWVLGLVSLASCGGGSVPEGELDKPAPEPERRLDGPADSYFGHALALDGDWLVVGAPSYDTYKGRVYAYDLGMAGTTAQFTFDGEAAYDEYGKAVDVDGTNVAIGAPHATTLDGTLEVAQAGKAYLRRLGTGASHMIAGQEVDGTLGFAVAISGSRMVLGAYREGTNYTGAIHEYAVPASGPPGKIRTIAGTEGSTFGWSVALDGSYCLVGAGGDQTVGPGTAEAIDLSGPTMVNSLAGEEAGDRFGWRVGVVGITGVVGAPWAGLTVNTGKVYRYELGIVPPTPIKTYVGRETGDNFGCAVAVSGPYLVIGAYKADDDWKGHHDAGKAYLYDWTTNELLAVYTGVAAGDRLGYAVAVSGKRVAVGCFGVPKVYVYDI